jgi:hypothetical protein
MRRGRVEGEMGGDGMPECAGTGGSDGGTRAAGGGGARGGGGGSDSQEGGGTEVGGETSRAPQVDL